MLRFVSSHLRFSESADIPPNFPTTDLDHLVLFAMEQALCAGSLEHTT